MIKVLLVDDDDLLRHALSLNLVEKGLSVVEARDGQEALSRYADDPADAIVLDILMPGKEGLSTIAEFRRLYPAAGIIAMSGGGYAAATTYLRMAECLGARAMLAKPFTSDELVARIQAISLRQNA